MTSVSGSSWKLCSALAIALASTLATGSLAAWGANFSTDSACWAGMLRIRSITRRAFIGVTRTCEAFAKAPRTSVSGLGVVIFLSLSAAPRPAVVLDVALEGPRRGELAQLVPDHALGDEHRDVLATVVHGDRVPEHVRDDRRATRPRLDHVLAALVVLVVHLLEQVVVDERALLQTAWHWLLPQRFLFVRRRRTISWSLALRRRVRPSGLPFGFTGWRPPDVLPSPPPCGWSTGFIATPRTVGRLPFHRMRPALPQLMLLCSALPTSPTVARQRTSTLRISPDGIRSWAKRPSRATSWTLVPAERAIFAPPPGRSSMA